MKKQLERLASMNIVVKKETPLQKRLRKYRGEKAKKDLKRYFNR